MELPLDYLRLVQKAGLCVRNMRQGVINIEMNA